MNAEEAARMILEDCKVLAAVLDHLLCSNRRGIKQEFYACDEEVIEEIIASWIAIIERVER